MVGDWILPPMGDDEVVAVVDMEEGVEEDLSVDHYGVLSEEARNAQRLLVSRNTADFIRGRGEMTHYDSSRNITDEKMFRVSEVIDWHSGEPSVVTDALSRGRVRARVSAAMGLGKSTVLPTYIAKVMNHRVLYVTLDANALHQCNAYLKATGIGRMFTTWEVKVKSHVSCMTYKDFVANNAMSTRSSLFKHFETFIFDEASAAVPEVNAAKKQFAVLGHPGNNLLLCSANIRDDAVGGEMESTKMGVVKTLQTTVSPEAALAGGKLVGEHLVDRTIVVLPSDERVHDFAEYYTENGVDVRTLDSAARAAEMNEVSDWLKGGSSTPRVLVVHCRYAIAYNFPVVYAVIFPLVLDMVVKGDTVTWEEVAMSQNMVNQAVARVGRGIAQGGNALVMGSERSSNDRMSLSNKVREFVYLVQSYIRPRSTPEWAEVHALFPNGIPILVAQQILKVNLPIEVAIRFLAKDGKFCRKYFAALRVFTQPDHYIQMSQFDDPVDYDKWIEEPVFGYEGDGPSVKVPIKATGELQVVLHAIYAFTEGKIVVEKWNPPVTDMTRPEPCDHQEQAGVIQARRLRRVRSNEKVVYTAPLPVIEGWSLPALEMNGSMGGQGTRKAVELNGDRMREALRSLKASVNDYSIPSSDLEVGQSPVGLSSEVQLPRGDVESPGGTVVCTVSGDLSNSLNSGALIEPECSMELVQLYRQYGNALVASRVFDGYGTAWTAVLDTFANDFVVGMLMYKGLGPFVAEFLARLRSRFSFELVNVAKNSHVYSKRFMRLFKVKPTSRDVISAIDKGRFDGMAQSDAFILRVKYIKKRLDDGLITLERNGFHDPVQYTQAQNPLPVMERTVVPNLAYGGIVRRDSVYGHSRSPSYGSQSRNW